MHENVDPARTVARVGGNASRVFTAGVQHPRDLIKAARNACGPSWAAGVTAVWSFKPHPGDVISGAWAPHIRALGTYLAANPANKTVVTIWHEPENDVGTWFTDPAGFVRMFDTVAGWLRETHPGVTVCHAALGYRYGDGIDIDNATAPAWRTSADLHCIDLYSGRSNPLNTTLPELSGYRRWRTHVARDSAWGVTERGWTVGKRGGPGDRVAAMTREAAWLQALPAAEQPSVYLLWSTEGTENDRGLIFDAAAEHVARRITAHCAGLDADPAAGGHRR